ncbi:RraA family protein [Ruania zhangjianzhongii]|uniref:RraA family protein n=1 Tax=Ruania zhangjianzhongii TaxID=2603206 RepID=UPI0011C79D69|nr:RraA family protein [Ruania zhangjianzhongii]
MTEPDAREIGDRLAAIYTGVLYDVVRDAGGSVDVLPHTITSLENGGRLAGRVFTMSGRIDESLDTHTTMMEWTGLLGRAPKDHVMVCQPNDSTISHMGELSAETLQGRGVRGYIVDGGCRDTDFIRDIKFPVWCRYTTPADIRGRWVPEKLEEPIIIGGVQINNGDYVVADRDGVLTLQPDNILDVIEAAEEAMQQESLVRAAIRAGTPPQEAYLKYRKF